jgi:hypothetical protein
MSEYIHYIQKEGEGRVNLETSKELGRIIYLKCEGLDTKGKRKNVYTEQDANSDNLHVWQGDEVTREATKITLTLAFIGDRAEREKAFDALYNYIKNGKFYYWDTARHKKAYFIFTEEYKTSTEMFYGSQPYILASFTLQNLWGECKKCDDNGNLI